MYSEAFTVHLSFLNVADVNQKKKKKDGLNNFPGIDYAIMAQQV